MSGGGRHACPARSAPAFDPRSLRLERPMPAPQQAGWSSNEQLLSTRGSRHRNCGWALSGPAFSDCERDAVCGSGTFTAQRRFAALLFRQLHALCSRAVRGMRSAGAGRHLRQPFDHSSMRGPRQPSNEARAPAWPGRGSKRNGGAPPDFSRGLWDASNGQQNNICAKLAFVRRRRIGVTTASAACSDRLPSEQESSHFCTSAGSNRRRGFGPVPRRRAPGSSACSYTNEAPTFSRSATPLTSSMPAFTKPNPALRDCRDRSRLARAGARTAKDVC
jgi:hypothetical protein